MTIKVFMSGNVLTFDYENHRGEKATRQVRFEGLDYGYNEWYPEPQWFLRGYCLDRQHPRSFALNRIDGYQILKEK